MIRVKVSLVHEIVACQFDTKSLRFAYVWQVARCTGKRFSGMRTIHMYVCFPQQVLALRVRRLKEMGVPLGKRWENLAPLRRLCCQGFSVNDVVGSVVLDKITTDGHRSSKSRFL